MFKNIINNVGTLVVAGKWNSYVFVPDWVKNNIFEREEMQINVALPAGPYKFRGEKIELTVSDSHLVLELLLEEESAQIEAILALRTILRLLNQTPVSAFGINFNYITDSDLSGYFNDLQGHINPLSEIEMKREVKWSLINNAQKKSINIRLIEENDKNFRFDVNNNFLVNNCMDITSLIDDDDVISKKKAECEQMLADKFNLNIEA